jgi:hypothetical protein
MLSQGVAFQQQLRRLRLPVECGNGRDAPVFPRTKGFTKGFTRSGNGESGAPIRSISATYLPRQMRNNTKRPQRRALRPESTMPGSVTNQAG